MRHERSHTQDKPFKCSECSKSFSYRESLVTHHTIHSGVKPYACENCQKTFSCIGNLIKHRKVRPDTCGKEEFKIQKINNRARVKLEKNVTTVTLPINDMIIQDPIVYEEVLTYDVNNQIKLDNGYLIPNETFQEVQVEDCMLDMMEKIHEDNSQQDEVEEHLEFTEHNSIELENEEKFTESSESVQNSHPILEDEEISQFMELKEDNYCCKLCPKIYQKKFISIKHLKKDHNILIPSFDYDDSNRYRKPQKNQSFPCKYCPKKFTSSKLVDRHQIDHGPSGNLIHKCSCCPLWFESLAKLEIHQISNHEDRLKCNNCMRKFDHPEKLLSHKKYAHSGKNAVTKKYVFVCTLCGRSHSFSLIALLEKK